MIFSLFLFFHQMHNSRESVANIELDVGSTSLGRVDMGHDPLASSIPDEPTSPSMETIRYQPAQVEHHQTPPDNTIEQPAPPTDDTTSVDLSVVPAKRPKGNVTMAPSDSLESIRSTESDSNELQSLMPRIKKDKVVPQSQSTCDDVTTQCTS